MNVLIVDDNKNNRMILRLLLEDYMDENSGIEFLMDEAIDGIQAVHMCDKKEYSIVFMDIMMPNMDGIEATKLIRQKHKKLMIIAVSAVDDAQRQKSILNNGAEDYILKPVNADIFTTRIDNYVSLIYAREHQDDLKKSNQKSINLFTKDVYNRHINFILSSEDALTELWEYYLVDVEGKCDHLSDVIRTIFSISEVQLKLNVYSNLYVEESGCCKYFTITKINEIPDSVLQLLLKKNEVNCEYKIGMDILTFKLIKSGEMDSDIDITPSMDMSSIEEEQIASSVHYTPLSLEVFTYIDKYDLSSLENYSSHLNSLMLLVGKGDIQKSEVVDISTFIEKISNVLYKYREVEVIAHALKKLSTDISTHLEIFMQNLDALGSICMVVSQDLRQWLEKSFYTGAKSVDFMNDTIALDCQTLSGVLQMNSHTLFEDDLDDIFDF